MDVSRLLAAPLEVIGRFADASNGTLLVRLTDADQRTLDEIAAALGREPVLDDLDPEDLAVYKPLRGERPLWDFPEGTLHRREAAAYEVSLALGWAQVPPTVVREEAPFGVGSVQRFVAHDPEAHYFTLLEAGDPHILAQLEAMVVFDDLIENADRKAGHVLLDAGGQGSGSRIWLIDHGVAFHADAKLRTVAWEWAGEPVADHLLSDVDRLRERLTGDLGARLSTMLADDEMAALRARAAELLERRTHPEPRVPYPYPWPLR